MGPRFPLKVSKHVSIPRECPFTLWVPRWRAGSWCGGQARGAGGGDAHRRAEDTEQCGYGDTHDPGSARPQLFQVHGQCLGRYVWLIQLWVLRN